MQENNNNDNKPGDKGKINRRDVLKGFATVPVLGAFAYGVWRKKKLDHYRSHTLSKELNMSSTPAAEPRKTWDGEPFRLGIIGYGGRGEDLLRGAGFAHPDEIQKWKDGAAKTLTYRQQMNRQSQRVVSFHGSSAIPDSINLCQRFM